jgi:hypothetical protein
MAISTIFKYSGKTLDNNCDAWITCHVRMRGLMLVRLTLSDAKAKTSTMA